ncbi:helix-turn-helix domain-containing protein [Streptomyces sp. TRM49041]|uniref:helix-turn-helix domain-containing protein n=1 Tax=Streptomyces sp. TRM49041 TaxID=2603216 RepID=UPI0011EEC6DE
MASGGPSRPQSGLDGASQPPGPGATGGPRPLLTPEQAEQAQQLYDSGASIPKIAQTFKTARSTIYRYITPKCD